MEHLEEDVLLAHTVGALPADRVPAVEAHLAACEACRTRQQNISSIVFSRTVAPDPTRDGPPTRPDAPGAKAELLEKGTSLGRYVLLERLGAGGMGTVYAAYDPQLDRKVALKLLRAGTVSAEEGRARLLREAQAMARLQHPNVIAVHDVGTFGDRVFVAMEFVEGETLGDWLRVDHPWREVLRIYGEAGAGLAAAHRAGLVHRDFKPDNVLLGQDGRPRVLDFGLARQAAATPPPRSLSGEVPAAVAETSLGQQLTRDGAVMGTPGYMAPEQISGLPTDARSDQFSFCVALYEGLYGKRPFGGATLKQHAQEIASGVLPPPPSGTPVPAWVYEVLKRGLAANPTLRWPDMDALLFRLRPRQARTGRIAVVAAGLGLVALSAVGFAAWTNQRLKVCGGAEKRLAGVWDAPTRARLKQAFLATRLSFAPDVWSSTERALDAFALEWVNASRDACEATRLRRVDSEEVYEMKSACLENRLQRLRALSRLFEAADREVVANAVTAARSLDAPGTCLDAAALRARTAPASKQEREAEAALRVALVDARALFDAGKYVQGRELLRKAIRAESPARAQAEAQLWLGRLEQKCGDVPASRVANQQAAEQAIKAGDAALQAFAFSRLFANEGFDAADDDADAWGRLAHAAAARVPGDWEVETEVATNDALVALNRRRFKAALADFERALQQQEEHLGAEHPAVAMTLNNLGVTLTQLGRHEEAIEKYQRSLQLHIALEGEGHPDTAHAEHNLGYVLRRQGRYAEAEQHYGRALAVRRAALGSDHLDTAKTMEALAIVHTHTGQHEAALALLEEALAVRQKVNGPESKEVAEVYDRLSELYQAGRHWKEALKYAELELAVVKKTAGAESLAYAKACYTVGVIHGEMGNWAEARRSLDEALRLRRGKLGEDSNEVASVLNAQGDVLLSQRRAAEALPLYERALAVREKAGSASPESMAADLEGMGHALLALDRPADAAAALTRAVALRERVEDKQELAATRFWLGRALYASPGVERQKAVALLTEAYAELSPHERRDAEAWLAKSGAAPALADAGAP